MDHREYQDYKADIVFRNRKFVSVKNPNTGQLEFAFVHDIDKLEHLKPMEVLEGLLLAYAKNMEGKPLGERFKLVYEAKFYIQNFIARINNEIIHKELTEKYDYSNIEAAIQTMQEGVQRELDYNRYDLDMQKLEKEISKLRFDNKWWIRLAPHILAFMSMILTAITIISSNNTKSQKDKSIVQITETVNRGSNYEYRQDSSFGKTALDTSKKTHP